MMNYSYSYALICLGYAVRIWRATRLSPQSFTDYLIGVDFFSDMAED